MLTSLAALSLLALAEPSWLAAPPFTEDNASFEDETEEARAEAA